MFRWADLSDGCGRAGSGGTLARPPDTLERGSRTFMQPPICALCGVRFDAGAATVRFSDYRPLPDGMVGHPHGLVWFCGAHLEAAGAVAHLPTEQALTTLRSTPPRSSR